jgi:hypothetical protein
MSDIAVTVILLLSGKQETPMCSMDRTHVFAVTAVIGSMPRSGAQEHLALRLPQLSKLRFSLFSPWILGDQRMRIKRGPENKLRKVVHRLASSSVSRSRTDHLQLQP